jgi:hypothetical protein
MSQTEQRAEIRLRSPARAAAVGAIGRGRLVSAGAAVRGWQWAARAILSNHRPYLALARRRHGLEVATDETELVIDGFPRSGNTFAVVAFQLVQPEPVRLSHHIHSSAHMIAAAKRGTPIVVTVREPEDAVLSCVIREPYVTIAQALRFYIAFYRRLSRRRERMVVAPFEEVVTDFGGVVARANALFGTSFAAFEHTPASVAECFGIIDDRARRPPWDAAIGAFLSGTDTVESVRAAARSYAALGGPPLPIPENRVARPSLEREACKAALRAAYNAARLSDLRASARHVYDRFTAS